MFIAAGLSGCIASDDGVDKQKAEADGQAAQADDVQDAGNATENQAPVALFTVTRAGEALDTSGGSIELAPEEQVDFDASNSTDADGDALTYKWSVDGTQRAETPVLSTAFEAGDHTVALMVSDGELVAEASLQVSVAALGGNTTLPSAGGIKHITFTGKFVAGDAVQGEGGAAKKQTKSFEVPAGTQLITGWLEWNDGATENSPLLTDIDVYVLNPSKEVAKVETADFEFIRIEKAADLVAGTWKIDLLPYDVPHDTEWTLEVFVWGAKPKTAEFKGNKAGVNLGYGADEVTGNADPHQVTVPEGASLVTARLAWSTAGQSSRAGRTITDYDLYALAGAKEVANSGNGIGGTEFLFKKGTPTAAVPGGEWSFEVVSFAVASADYVLTVEYL